MRRVLAALAICASLCACARSHRASLARTAHDLRPSVVLVTVMLTQASGTAREYASGAIVASGAWGSDIVTVAHAVQAAQSIHVTVADAALYRARVVAQNHALDVALLRIKRGNLPTVALGTSAQARPGRLVGLVGYPIPDQFHDQGFGLTASVAAGRIAARLQDALELMLPVVPGESGAPVFLAHHGVMIGLAESRFSSEHSIGFALPADDVRRFLHASDAAHGF